MTQRTDPKRNPRRTPDGVPSEPTESGPHFLARASKVLAASLDYENTLVTVAELSLPYLGSWCIVDVLEPDDSMRRLDIIHPDPLKEERARRLKESWPPRRNDPIGLPLVMLSRTTELIPTVSDEMLVDFATSEENLENLRALGIGSVLVVPLIARDQVLGAMTFISADVGHPYTQRDVDLAEDVAARSAIALDNARLFRDLKDARQDAEDARQDAAELNEQLVVSSIRQQELAEEARDANQTKSQFLATVSHEIRTPLHAILGYTELLERGIAGPLTDGQKEYLGRLRASSGHLIGLIDDILDLSKLESGGMPLSRESIAAQRSVSGAVDLVEPQASAAGVEIETDCPEETCFYLGDEHRVRQILVILLSNAVKFTEPGGRISVSCGSTTTPDEEAALTGGEPWTFLRVTDTGIGISEADAETVFQPFVQADSGYTRKHGGAGLGLAIGLELAHRMGGDLTLRSAAGEGSCFTLWLPASAEPRDEGTEDLEGLALPDAHST